jgi:two-component system chemotaxis sensor kinase CheA
VRGDPYKYFRVEARELLEQVARSVLELERGGPAKEVVPRLLRLAHTLKGAARVVKQREVADLAHEIETELLPFRDADGVARQALDRTLALADAASERVGKLQPAQDASVHGGAPLAADESFRTLRTDVAEMDGLLDGVAETQAELGSMRRLLGSVAEVRRLAAAFAGQASARGPGPSARSSPGIAGRTAAAAEELGDRIARFERGLGAGLERIDRQLRLVRDAGERLRLFPAGTLFGALERAVRDAARTLGRSAAFRRDGGDIRLDGHVLDALQPALVQLVRNAVAHGIEPADERGARGKASEGSVVLEVRRRGRRVAFTCRDDGRGVDLAAVRRALAKAGLQIPATQGMESAELLRALLGGGVSTAAGVTEVSGRGIGLDVVRSSAASLGGQVAMTTRPGEGTAVEIVVPVSLASLEVLLVEASSATVALPLDAVRGTLRAAPRDIAGAEDSPSLLYEAGLAPFLPLSQLLGNDGAARRGDRAATVVMLAGADGLAAVGVDRLLGTASLLVRPLPRLAPADPIVGGAALDSEGNPQLVLDPDRIVAAARRGVRRAPATAPEPRRILVVDDSLTTRMLEQSILESAGYAVELATSGEEALEKARRNRYALMLVDVEMPGMDGFALLEQLRSDADLRSVPTILVTSRAAPEDRSRGTAAGARAYIVKSEFDQAELLETIRRLVA